MSANLIELLPLPKPYYPQWSHSNELDAFTSAQMRAYADACVRAALAQSEAYVALINAGNKQEPTVSLSEYNRLQDLVTSQGIRLMEYESEPSQPAAPAVPAGYKLVPVEPTKEMLRAALMEREGTAVYRCVSSAGIRQLEDEVSDVFAAMLAAAPEVK